MDSFTIVGRALAQDNPELFQSLEKKVTPLLTDQVHIEEIFHMVNNLFSDEPEWMRKLLFVSAVYDCYCPGSYYKKSIMKLPIGVRDEVARLLGQNNGTMVNYFRDQTQSYMRFREKEFGSRIDQIKGHFVHGQIKMFA